MMPLLLTNGIYHFSFLNNKNMRCNSEQRILAVSRSLYKRYLKACGALFID